MLIPSLRRAGPQHADQGDEPPSLGGDVAVPRPPVHCAVIGTEAGAGVVPSDDQGVLADPR
jgi:hypothetical protein